MYTVSEVVEMGKAHELVLSVMKDELMLDDSWPESLPSAEYFDE